MCGRVVLESKKLDENAAKESSFARTKMSPLAETLAPAQGILVELIDKTQIWQAIILFGGKKLV